MKACFLWIALWMGSPVCAGVKISIRVQVPHLFANLPAIYLAGNTANLQLWNPQGLRLQNKNGIWSGEVEVPQNTTLEMKLTLGSWEQVEVFADGYDRPNRTLHCMSDCLVDLTAENFRLAGGYVHPMPRTASKAIQYHHNVYAPGFQNYRSIAVYVPPDYEPASTHKYPVLYALDGHNLFDNATASFGTEWQLDKTLDAAIKAGRLPPMIIVGIYATEKRSEEYNSSTDYAKFIRDTVKPLIDSIYRVDPSRDRHALMGASFGGNFTLNGMYSLGDIFSRFAALSPALWWNHYSMLEQFNALPPQMPMRTWIDMGDQEGFTDGVRRCFQNGVHDISRVHRSLMRAGLHPERSNIHVQENGTHHETSWGRRSEQVLQFIFDGV